MGRAQLVAIAVLVAAAVLTACFYYLAHLTPI